MNVDDRTALSLNYMHERQRKANATAEKEKMKKMNEETEENTEKDDDDDTKSRPARAIMKDKNMFWWPKGKIPYTIDDNFGKSSFLSDNKWDFQCIICEAERW